ncbi:hypothetical protein VNO78_20999 [Psophocarpus tetragonolobus]|uniref:Uncharacterized protein n=1 Tax=Psophocarpus tetragonolobus TaxID=3891 RepID=A0AAN9XHR6_PSOTE
MKDFGFWSLRAGNGDSKDIINQPVLLFAFYNRQVFGFFSKAKTIFSIPYLITEPVVTCFITHSLTGYTAKGSTVKMLLPGR